MKINKGIALNMHLATLVEDGSLFFRPGTLRRSEFVHGWPGDFAVAGDVLTHVPTPTGLRPVDEIVEEIDQAHRDADWLCRLAGVTRLFGGKSIDGVADRIIERAFKTLPEELYDAWHMQNVAD